MSFKQLESNYYSTILIIDDNKPLYRTEISASNDEVYTDEGTYLCCDKNQKLKLTRNFIT